MSELKDPAIKLFGKTIPLPETSIPANTKSDVGFQFPDKSNVMDVCNGTTNTESEDVHVGDGGKPEKCIVSTDGVEDHIAKNNNEALVNPKLKEDHDKVLKKPDKIIPCPRCKSLETKFCYFNNYNVNQPRHFCRNCQRYWTAGGAMRSVPVGAGRRKSKQLASQLLPCGESPTAFRPTTGNGSVLNFGSETPLSESMGTVLSRRDQKRCSDLGSVVENKEEDEIHERVGPKEKGDLSISLNKPTMSHSPQCYPIPQLVPALCAPNIPLQFVPAAYWGCLPYWAVGTGNMPMTPSSSCNNTLSNNVSPILGKHLRDENSMDEEKSREMHYHP